MPNTNGTWLSTTGGAWGTTSNWQPPSPSTGIVADGSGYTAYFVSNIAANATVTTTVVAGVWTGTIGNLEFSDGGAAGSTWTVGALTLASPSGASTINTITPAILNGALTGTVDVYKSGASSLTLSGTNTNLAANKTVYINAGTLITSNASAFSSTATFVVASGATLNPTVAINRTGTIAGTGASGTGAITNAQLFTGTATLTAPSTISSTQYLQGTYQTNGNNLTIQIQLTNLSNATAFTIGSATPPAQVKFIIGAANNTLVGTNTQTYTVTDKVIIAGDSDGILQPHGVDPRNLGAASNPVRLESLGAVFTNVVNQSFSHNLTVNNGVIATTTTNLTSSGNISIESGSNLYTTGNGAATVVFLNGVISGAGNLMAGAAGILNTYTTCTTHLGNVNNTFTGEVTVNNTSVLYVYGDNSLGNPGVATNINMAGGSLLPASGTTVSLPVNRPIVATAALTFAVAGSNSLTIRGNISESGASRALTKSSTGTLGLSGTNSLTGTTTHSGGTLALNSNGALGGGGAYTMSAAATLDNQGASAVTLSSNNAIALNGNPTFAGSNNLTFGTGNITINAARTFTINGTAPTTGGSSGSTLRFRGGITTATALALTKGGVGRLTIDGAVALTATAHSVNAGAYQTRNANGLGAAATALSWTVANGAALEVGGSVTLGSSAKSVILSGTGQSSYGALLFVDSGNTMATPILYNTAITIGADAAAASNIVATTVYPATATRYGLTSRPLNGASITYSDLFDITTFEQTGAGTSVINYPQSATSSTVTVSSGVLEISSSGSFPATPAVSVTGAGAGTLRIKRATGAFGASTTITIGAQCSLQAGTADGKLTHAGHLTLGTASSANKAVIKFGTT